jgi:hypothetical protein
LLQQKFVLLFVQVSYLRNYYTFEFETQPSRKEVRQSKGLVAKGEEKRARLKQGSSQ